MAATDHSSIDPLIDQVVLRAKRELSPSEPGLFIPFIRFYYSQTSMEDLEDTTVETLYGAVKSHWRLMEEKGRQEFKIRIFNPQLKEDGWQSKHTVIQAGTDDVPFLVDSMRMELNRLGLTIHLMIHMGGMKIERDREGKIKAIFPYDSKSEDAKIESPIYMEIDRQTDSKVLLDIERNIKRVLDDVRVAVDDWGRMQQRLRETIETISSGDMPQKASEVNESIAFLEWMLEDHFTFLGTRDYEKVGQGDDVAMRLVPGSGLGVLRDESRSKVIRKYSELPESARRMALSKDQMLIISKTNTRSTIHRPTYTDYVGVKIFNKTGELIRERRFIGLYTSSAYSANPKAIPFLRKKVALVFKKSGLPVKSHAGKDLMHILSTLPRDDLFQSSADELYRISMGILHLQERRKIRLFVREDDYGRFISCLVYIPRDNFNTDVLNRMMKTLKAAFHGTEVGFNTLFSASILARIHFVVRIDPKKKLKYNIEKLEAKLAEIGKSWYDGFREAILEYFGEERGNQLFVKYRHVFPAGYREVFASHNAVYDVEYIESLSSNNMLGMSFYRPAGASKDLIKFKLFRQDQTVPLSDALPMLENMGLRVIGEQPYQITFNDGSRVWINDFSMTYVIEPTFEVEEVKTIFQEAFNKIWLSDAENDAFNRLVLEAQLNWREISMLRACAKYLRQTGFTYSPEYIAETLINNAGIAHLLVDLFKYYFDPEIARESQEAIEKVEKLLEKKLDDVAILDEDRILRRCLDIIHATLRTNYFQVTEGQVKSYLSFKFDPSKIPELPLPLPKYEIYVYSPRFEGVHLRADKVARGGIRWSDRREDFRTEILGLMKAQSVKNAVIVPAGAKGGFIPKCLPADASREEILEEGIACYRGFIQGLLDLTDNLKGNRVIPPTETVCYDDHDPYLVVAADKGTATFSDIANCIAIERKYWLGDAFASGGSTGYDHKKMGITARGAWVSAERHFQELGINVDETEVTVVGIGDMSGDVFGNGMLLSQHLKLVAAFNHLHIFIDPDPNPMVSYQERERLFNLPRSSWADYDRKLISEGGGVYRRTAKSVSITPEIKKLLDITKDSLVPNELIRAILRAPVDLIWNGGIGTYVKECKESNLDVGDRANDAVRINGADLRARVICEGGNLGLTQLARVEYELNGGKINTDFIDNSAGVDCSDHEVNIKILLNNVVASGDLTEKQRNTLLARMTDEVADLVLQNNYHQNQAISLASYLSPANMNLYMHYISAQEQAEKINRALEFIPDDKTLMERKSAGLGLTRPEIAILFAYSKIILEDKIRNSDLPEDPYLSRYVKDAFPTPLRKRYSDLLIKHRLSREIISTQLSNRIVSSMGLTFNYQLQDETGATTSSIVRSYAVAHKIFHMEDLYADIESLDYKVDATVQHQMTDDVVRLVRRATRWFLRNRREHMDIEKTINHFCHHVLGLSRRLPKLILGDDKARLEEYRDALIAANVAPEIALKIAGTTAIYHALNIIEAASVENADVYHVAKIYFILVDRLDLLWFRDQINEFSVDSHWTVLAKAAYKGDLDLIQRELTLGVLHLDVKSKSITARINAWFNQYKPLIARWQSILGDIRSTQVKDFEIFSVAIRGLSELAQANIDVKRKNQRRDTS